MNFRQPLGDDGLCLAHDSVDELFPRRHVVDEPGDHAALPRTGLHVTVLQYPADSSHQSRRRALKVQATRKHGKVSGEAGRMEW